MIMEKSDSVSLPELWYNSALMSQSLDTLAIHRSRRVMVAVKMMNATGRQRLRGVYRYLAEGHDWDLQLVRAETELTAPGIRQAERDGIQGFLVCYHPSPETLAALADSHVPVVSFMTNPIPKRKGFFRLPDEDNVHIGVLAAEHFRSLGRFRSFGFVPDVDDLFWSRQRLEGFRRGLGKDARRLAVFKPPAASPSDASSLTDWLLALPKPTAVMASWDYRAAEVISACRNAGLAVPAQVAVCGMDDDEFICDSASPPLTSIRADREGQGHAAATVLGAIMDGILHPRIRSDPFHTASLVIRGSSAPIAPATSLVERALVLVEQQALSGISAANVAKRLGVSRRLMDMRFRQLGLPSVADELTSRRLGKVKQLLAETRLPLDRIADLSGFVNADSMRNLFRRRFGLSMRAFRNAQHGRNPEIIL